MSRSSAARLAESLRHAGKERRPGGMATRGLPGLDWLNFFVADFQTAFGPFISVYLTSAGWTQSAIGAALSTGAFDVRTGVRLTHRWRGMDSNFRFRVRCKRGLTQKSPALPAR